MTGFRKRMAQGLVATIMLCAVGFMVCGSVSARGNVWERVCIVLMFVMLASMVGAIGLVAATYFKLRVEVAKHVGRLGLENDEIRARMATRQVMTFGDVVLIASSLAGHSKEVVRLADGEHSNAVWDRALDG
jgi:hypothetical protein